MSVVYLNLEFLMYNYNIYFNIYAKFNVYNIVLLNIMKLSNNSSRRLYLADGRVASWSVGLFCESNFDFVSLRCGFTGCDINFF